MTDIPRAYRNLGEFVSFLEAQGELHRVTVPVDRLVGEENGGWRIAVASLMFERVMGDLKAAKAYLNEFAFRHNRRFWKFSAFQRLLQLALETQAPSYRDIYEARGLGEGVHPRGTSTENSV